MAHARCEGMQIHAKMKKKRKKEDKPVVTIKQFSEINNLTCKKLARESMETEQLRLVVSFMFCEKIVV